MRYAAAVFGLLAALAACGQETIDVRAVDPKNPEDYGRGAILVAREGLLAQPSSPEAYARFAAAVRELGSRMTEEVADLAERELMFGAGGPMEAYRERAPEEQRDALATTVWSTLFEVPARPGETPLDYVARVCDGELADECRYYVPEARALVLVARAWRALARRARNAYVKCAPCEGDPTYTDVVDRYHERAEAAEKALGDGGASAETSDWPIAGANASPWTEPLLFQRTSGATLDGAPVPGGGWREAFAAARGDRTVLGVYLRPGDRVQTLRAVAADAAAAGFRELALVARAAAYPFDKREYRLQIGKRARGHRVRVRDVETVQVLVQAIDATIAAHGPAVRL